MEDYVGFHSEYFVDINWVYRYRNEFEHKGYTYGVPRRLLPVRGYTRFASHTIAGRTNNYFIWDENFICITDFHNHKVLKLQGKKLDKGKDFIAVNSSGIYIYNTREIYLFDFNGKLINKHEFGQANYVECIYFYGEYAYYSETKTTNTEINVWMVYMPTGEKKKVYACHKAVTSFDDAIKLAYKKKYKREIQTSYLKTPSNIGNPHCTFLYADAKNVYVGYTRIKQHANIAYILVIDLETQRVSVLDVIIPEGERDVYYGALNLSNHSGWVIGSNNLCEIRSLDYRCSTDVLLPSFQPIAKDIRGSSNESSDSYYIKNGEELYQLSQSYCRIFRYEQGIKDDRVGRLNWKSIINHGHAPIEDYTFADNDMVIRECFSSWYLYDLSGVECDSELAVLKSEEISKLIEDYKDDDETMKSVDKKSKLEQPPVRNAVSENIHNSVINKVLSSDLTQQKTKLYCANCGQKLPETARFCFSCGNSISNIDSADMFQQSETDLTLAEFRQNAPSMAGYREELLAFRKSLSNSWDYNAYVGILLGVGGSKHGDAACMNFAIGQGDNGNNVKKTLEAKGLMPLFEKYKGKKINSSILLSDVEKEILSVAPEYASISQRLSGVLHEKSDGISTPVEVPVEVPVKPAKTVQTVSKVKTVVAEPNKVKPVSVEETMLEKYKKLPCHTTAYSFAAVYDFGLKKWNDSFNCSSLVQEYEGYLYYVKNSDFYRIPIRSNSPSSIIARFERKSTCYIDRELEQGRSPFKVGVNPTFCINNGKMYFSRPQIEGRTAENNQIISFTLSDPSNLRVEFELEDFKMDNTIFNPYVIKDKVLVGTCAETGFGGRPRWLLDKSRSKELVLRDTGSANYLSINDETIISNTRTSTAVYHLLSGKKTSIEKEYKGAKDKQVIFIDAKRDILYYLETSDAVCGKIVGIDKNGKIVDIWEEILDSTLLNKVKSHSIYSSFSFDANLRVFKITAKLRGSDGGVYYENCIYAVDRNGNCDERFKYQYTDSSERYFSSALHIQTPNAVIVHLEEKQGVYREYMITTTGEKNCKPLFG